MPSCFPGDKAIDMALDCFRARMDMIRLFSAAVTASSLIVWVVLCSSFWAVD
jgi:hypothetical protein